MHLDGKHVVRLALAIFILGVRPCFSEPGKDEKWSAIPFPPLTKAYSLSDDFKSLLERAEKGDADAQELVGAAYCEGAGVTQDYHQGFLWLQKAADQKNAHAISWLGLLYANGFGVPQDQAKAFQYYLAAATAGGNANDQVQVAERYVRGNGVSPSEVESLSWYVKAAAQDNPEAELKAGVDYFVGKGATRDDEKAFGYFLGASYHDVPRAQFYMAYFYWNGIFVQRDPAQAYKWIQLATRRDHEIGPADLGEFMDLFKRIDNALTPEQVGQGEVLLNNWPRERRGLMSGTSLHATFKSGTSAKMPFESIEGEIVITVTINDHDKLKFMLDTGASISLIDGISVSQYKIPRSSIYHAVGGIGKQTVLDNHTDNLSLELPGLRFDHVSLDISQAMARIDGVLGYDILSNYVIKIDYVAKTVEFVAPQSFKASDAGQLLDSRIDNTKIYVSAKIDNNNFKSYSENFVLDTGCAAGFVLSKHFTLSYPQLAFSGGFESKAMGIGGDIWSETVPCFGAQIGDMLMKDPLVTVVKRDQGVFLHINGLIGNEIWKNYDLTIDYPNKRLYVKPNSSFSGSSATAPVSTEAPRGPD